MITAREIVEMIRVGIAAFGSYSYEDKGANEVIDMGSIMSRLKEMSADEILRVLGEVEESDINAGPFLDDCIPSFEDHQDADRLFATELFQRWS